MTELYEPLRQKTNLRTRPHNEDSDHPAHLRGLIRIINWNVCIATDAKFLYADSEDSD